MDIHIWSLSHLSLNLRKNAITAHNRIMTRHSKPAKNMPPLPYLPVHHTFKSIVHCCCGTPKLEMTLVGNSQDHKKQIIRRHQKEKLAYIVL